MDRTIYMKDFRYNPTQRPPKWEQPYPPFENSDIWYNKETQREKPSSDTFYVDMEKKDLMQTIYGVTICRYSSMMRNHPIEELNKDLELLKKNPNRLLSDAKAMSVFDKNEIKPMKPNIHQMRLFGPQMYNFYKTPLTTSQKMIGYHGAAQLKTAIEK